MTNQNSVAVTAIGAGDVPQRDGDLFQALLERIPQSRSCQQLEEATLAGLQLLLRRPEDRELLDPMRSLVISLTRGVSDDMVPQTARQCVRLLQEAQRLRRPRKVVYMGHLAANRA